MLVSSNVAEIHVLRNCNSVLWHALYLWEERRGGLARTQALARKITGRLCVFPSVRVEKHAPLEVRSARVMLSVISLFLLE